MAVKNPFELELSARKTAGYSHFKNRVPVISRLYVKNTGAEDAALSVIVESDTGVFLPFRSDFVLPAGSTVEPDLENLSLSPFYLSGLSEPAKSGVTVKLEREGKAILSKQFALNALPFDCWKPESEFCDLLAGFVKPRHPEIAKLRLRAQSILEKWKLPSEISGYEGASKNSVRQIAAAYYSALQLAGFTRLAEEGDGSANPWDKPQRIRGFGEILSGKKATSLELGILVASCLESSGFHPVLVFGKRSVSCAVWLYDNCFMDAYLSDPELVKKHASEGVNSLSAFDLDCLFRSMPLNFTGAEKKFRDEADGENVFLFAVDVKRCRAGGVRPLPERLMTERGAELLTEEDTALDEAPADIRAGKVLKVKQTPSREKQWERRLLDLSQRNMLLHFRPSVNTLHLVATELSETCRALLEKGTFNLAEMPPDPSGVLARARNFDTKSQIKSLSELNSIELKNKRLRSFVESARMKITLSNLYRRERTAVEEMGADPLYLALGFLKWYEREDSQFPKYAPLILIPVSLGRRDGGKGFSLSLRGEAALNTTLLEFLKQEFNVDIRGLDTLAPEEIDVESVVASVRGAVVGMHGWDVVEDMHLAIFSFTRFLMWSDIRNHMDEFNKNRIVKSLTENRLRLSAEETKLRDYRIDADFRPKDVLLPIPADETQFAAVADASEGRSFVLHGPPGTGKSQTITNLIANAVAGGKRVLFVAEKMAALSVVKKRLEGIGIGDFCLELHSNKADKSEVAEQLLHTLELAKQKDKFEFEQASTSLSALREQLNAPVSALHKRHYLGISVYEAVLKYFESKDAPDVMEIDSAFCDGLTPDTLADYERILEDLSSSARECGEVYRSPYNDLTVSKFSLKTKSRLVSGSRILKEEIRHAKSLAELVFDFFRHRVRTFTKSKLDALSKLCALLSDEGNFYAEMFSFEGVPALLSEFSTLYRGEYGEAKREYDRRFDAPAELPAPAFELWSELADYKTSKKFKVLTKRLKKVSRSELREETLPEAYRTVLRLSEAQERIEELGGKISRSLGRKNDPKTLSELAGKLETLFGLAEEVFSEYDEKLFSERCAALSAEDGFQILKSFLSAYGEFGAREGDFFREFGIKTDYRQLDEDYLDYLDMKCSALAENADLLASWCCFRSAADKLEALGLTFAVSALLAGTLTSDNLLSCFRKKVYRYYIDTVTKEDEVLSAFSGGQLEDRIEKFRRLSEEFDELTKREILRRLTANVPSVDTEGSLSLEIVALQKTAKSAARSFTLRKLFDDIPHLLGRLAPCMLMSPISVAQYISPTANAFDLVVFDEASQMPTAEAVGAIARGKSVVVVGDPRQLPPTSFFNSDYVDEENLEIEDLESILDDCLALGMPERHLLWHYRSKHESLIAFSNAMYYGNKLNTFPSPDAMESKVTMKYLPDAVYDRGATKQNRKEAEALVAEVKRRLSDPELRKSSIGIVTFSTAQQVAVETQLSAMLVKTKLEAAAYEREEPVFVKNLENVQGDERDVILFSVGYGPDRHGSLVLNFGPLNQSAGWRRLNVAVSRAREEMIVYSSMTSAMIDLSRTNSKGVAGLKRFLEFADKGRTMLAINSRDLHFSKDGIGAYIANELRSAGFECRSELGVSGFKIDVAVADPDNPERFALAVLCDGDCESSAKDRNVLRVQTLKRLGWNVCRVWTLNFAANPKREIRRVKDLLSKLLEREPAKRSVKISDKFQKPYKTANIKAQSVSSAYLFDAENEETILSRMLSIVDKEEPISKEFLIKRCLTSYGILRTGAKINARMEQLCGKLAAKSETLDGTVFFCKTDECGKCGFYRIEGDMSGRDPADVSPCEFVAAMRSVLSEKIALYPADLAKETAERMKFGKSGAALSNRIAFSSDYGVEKSFLIRSVDGKMTLA